MSQVGCTTTASHTSWSLPVIDVGPFVCPDDDASSTEEAKQRVGQEVHAACIDTGFFLIKNYQAILPQERIERLFGLMRSFFTLPAQQKHKLKSSHGRGYFSFGEENLSTVYPEHNVNFEDKELGDYKEGIDFGPEIDLADPHYGEIFHMPNQWPHDELVWARWKKDVLEHFALASQLGRVLNRVFAVSLGLPENWFADRIGEPMPTLRLLHYPPSPAERTRMGCGAHSDYGCCAILAQDDAGGLELYNQKKEKWVPITPVPDTLVINIGDMMQRWTNDRYKSTLHRVINPASRGKHRFSSPFFFEPGPECIVECIPTCLREGEKPRYPPIRFGDHLLRMYQSTFYVNQ